MLTVLAMEVTVTGGEGLPPKAVVSIRAGETRRQAPFSKNEVFRFPTGTQKSLIIDVFEKVGTSQMSLAGIGEAPGKVTRELINMQRGDGVPMNLGLKVEMAEEQAPSPKKSPTRNRHHAAVKAKSYLEEQGVQVILQDLVQKLLAKQPEDALLFMADYIKDKMNQAPTHRQKKTPQSALRGYAAMPGLGDSEYPGFPALSCPSVTIPDLSAHQHVMAGVLRRFPPMYGRLRNLRTSKGVTLAKCLKPGVDDLGQPGAPGLVAGDPECYTVFQELFDAVLVDCRGGEKLPVRQPINLNSTEVSDLPLDPAGKSVVSVRVSAARSLEGLRFPTACSADERMEVERAVTQALEGFAGELEGEYYPLQGSSTFPARPDGMSSEESVKLGECGVLFGPPEAKALLSSGVGRNWPQARGVFASADEVFAVQINETEHLRVIVTLKGSDLKKAFGRFCLASDALSLALQQDGHAFARSERLGFLCAEPSELGTALSAIVTVRLPRLGKQPEKLAGFCAALCITAAKAANTSGALDISNAERLGSSEVDQVNVVIKGCQRLIELEAMLERGEALPDKLPDAVPAKRAAPAAQAHRKVSINSTPKTAAVDEPAEVADSPGKSFADVPGLGAEEYPGFPTSTCPAALPNIKGHHSLMADVLKKDPSLYESLKGISTTHGVTLAKVIKPGIDNKGHVMIRTAGLVAGDEECYSTFAPLFDQVVDLKFGSWPSSAQQPFCLDVKQVNTELADPTGKHILAVELRLGRNLREMTFAPSISVDERREVERVLSKALLGLCGELNGTYYPLKGSNSFVPMPGGMVQEDQEMLEKDQFLFREPDSSVALSSGVGRHWPDARGVFKSDSRRFSAWINEEDHLKLILKEDGPDLRQAFSMLCLAEGELQSKVMQDGYKFSRSDRLGFLATCPANIGTNLRACMTVSLPNLSSQPGFRDFCKTLKLQVRNVGSSFGGAGVWEVSNVDRLGSSEADQVNDVIDGCRKLVTLEEKLERGEPVSLQPQEPAKEPAKEPEKKETAKLGSGSAHGDDEEEEEEEPPGVNFAELPGLGPEEYPGFPVDACPDAMPDISGHFTLMADVLNKDPSIYEKLKNSRTTSGVTFAKVIKPGIDNKGHAMIKTCGATAGDEESYTTFSALFDPLISLRHGGFSAEHVHRADLDYAKVDSEPIDPTGKHVLSTRLKLVRNLRGFRFPAACSFDERREVERVATEALMDLSHTFSGEYYPLHGSMSYPPKAGGMNVDDEHRLGYSKLLFQEPDSGLLLASGMGRDWPDARGIFASDDMDVGAWVNEEDHLSLFVTQSGGDIKEAFARLCQMHSVLQASVQQQGHDFMHNERLGFLTADASNLGSGLRASITISIPLLSTAPEFKDVCRNLQVNSTRSPSRGCWEISNADRLGSSEVESMCLVVQACRCLIELEADLEHGLPLVRPGMGSAPLPGFPISPCPTTSPNWSAHRNVLGQVLRKDPSIYSELCGRQTLAGTSFSQVIKPGVDVKTPANRVLPIGIVAGDAECYTTFARLFMPAIQAYHGSIPPSPRRRNSTMLDPTVADSGKLDTAGSRVTSVCIRAARCLNGMRFPSTCSFDERREVERILVGALEELTGDLEGDYFPLAHSNSYVGKPGGMSTQEAKEIRSLGVLFQEPKAPAPLAAGLGRDWPDARGVFVSRKQRMAAWINEEEHLSLIAMQKGDDLQAAFATLCSGEHALELALQQEGYAFARSDRLGFLTTSPERLGTALTVSVTLKVPELAARSDLSQLCASFGLTVVSKGAGGNLEVANSATLGVSEAAVVRSVADGVRKLLDVPTN